MAKRKSEVMVRKIVGNMYEAWMDDDIADKVRAMPPIQEVYGRGTCGAPWGIKLDPRYNAAEVIAEIEGLGSKSEPCDSCTLGGRARSLGREAAYPGQLVWVITEVLEAAEEDYGFGYELTLADVIASAAKRLANGSWQ